MKTKLRLLSFASLLSLVALGWLWPESTLLQAAPPADKKAAAEPVESDIHEYMEYIHQPTFKRLKAAIATEPAGNQDWLSIKSGSLILAESGNLLLIRKPEADAADWVKHCVQIREFGGQLYRAAQAKNFTKARKHYESMVQNCNACHQQFAGGEHMLTP